MRVLVTGSSGFIGSRTLSGLSERNIPNLSILRKPPKDDKDSVALDLLDFPNGAISKIVGDQECTHLLHIASALDRQSPERYQSWLDTSKRLVKEFFDAGGTRAVIVGSANEAHSDSLTPNTRTPENIFSLGDFPSSTLYGQYKLDLLRWMAEKHDESTWAWARPFQVFGPNEVNNRLTKIVMNAFQNGQSPELRSNQQIVRDFVSVGDVARGLATLTEDDSLTGQFNLATGVETSFKDYIGLLADEFNFSRDQIKLPDAKSPDPAYMVADPQLRLSEETDWRPTDLKQAIRETVREFQQSLEKQLVASGSL
ncbi:MAG: NAD(P)-dependent oxidoreductase [Candidatus Caenarcaniphilales bacterium]|nr:NAD(P)-dependent oxidoreductase [Candidatus Caenarcaniphilales bacterium]